MTSRLAAFAVALAALFGIATFAGAAVGPDRADGGAERSTAGAAEGAHSEDEPGAAGATDAAHAGEADPVRGLAVSADGLTLALGTNEFARGRARRLSFRVLDQSGAPVRDFDVEHERRMHVIVVRRDGSGFQHLHPELAADGTWSAPVTLPQAGAHRVFADFSHDGEPRTLAADLTVDGQADYRPLPAPSVTADAGDGYEVRVDAPRAGAGDEAALEFDVTRNGQPVRPEPYLGARGHLVALREGDLAFLHVHPDEDSLAFMAEFPSAGRYGLYLQFKHEGEVHTAAFTQDVPR
jgi:hypothetical protein